MFFFFSSRRRHTSWPRDWSSDVCSSDLRKDGATALSLAGSVKATSLSASSGLSARMVAGTQEPVMNIGTVSWRNSARSEEHTSELQSRGHLVCRLLLEKKKRQQKEEDQR